MNFESIYIYELSDWVHEDKLNRRRLSMNPNAIHLLEKYPEKIYWRELAGNRNAIFLYEKYPEKISWRLSSNLNAMPLLEKNSETIDWDILSGLLCINSKRTKQLKI